MSSTHSASIAEPATPSIVAPYITAWSAETDPPATVVAAPGIGVRYADERPIDRDRHGILWARASWHPGQGRPVFARVHPTRQRRAMYKLLCQVCGGPADRTDNGVLWLMRDHRNDWPDWPNRMAVVEPPICRPCLHLSVRVCPALRKGAVAVRAESYPVVGVRGCLYTGQQYPVPAQDVTVPFGTAALHWVKAVNLVRELQDCTLLEVADLAAGHMGPRVPIR